MRKLLLLSLFAAGAAFGHLGSPDIFLEGKAGPYPLFVTIKPPTVIPGVAEIEIRSASADLRELHITPMPLTGDGAKFAPVADTAERSKDDPQFYTGALWMMSTGSWQVRVRADGALGSGTLSVPVPAVPTRTKGMQATLGYTLFGLMVFLSVGSVVIIGAAIREGRLDPGTRPGILNKRNARIAMAGCGALVLLILWGGNNWWTAEASGYSDYIYKPLTMAPSVDSGGKLTLQLGDPGWAVKRKLDDFLPDHNHLMHLYIVHQPELDRVWHLHPEMSASGVFTHKLPNVPAGDYRLYADVVHKSGFPETMVANLNVPSDIAGTPLTGDDALGTGMAVSKSPGDSTVAELPDGYKMVWDRDQKPLRAKHPGLFHFHLEDKNGKAPQDMQMYMGMMGHAAFLKTDGTVFAHIHPSGSIAMAALDIADAQLGVAPHDMSKMDMSGLPASVSFPYGFPQPGQYRIIVQMKHGATVETGMFDARVGGGG